MKVYYVSEGETKYYGTLDQAKRAARSEAETMYGGEVRVERLDVATDKDAFIAALNGQTGIGDVVYKTEGKL